jgi:hypothetical protein
MASTVDAAAPVAPPVRRILFTASALVFLAGVQLFLFPRRTDEFFAWTIASPMTAVFLGAAYWSAVGLEVAAARAATWAGARIALPAVFVFTALTFVVTLVHLDLFHLGGEFAANTRVVTWAWMAIYGGVPIIMVIAFRDQRRLSLAVPPPTGLPALVRAVLTGLALLFLGLGSALLVAPTWADRAWPWALTPLTARAIGAWLVGLGVAAAHARHLDDAPSLRPLGSTGALFALFQTIALLREGGELDWGGVPAAAYVTVIAVLGALSLWSLLVTGGLWARPSRRAA